MNPRTIAFVSGCLLTPMGCQEPGAPNEVLFSGSPHARGGDALFLELGAIAPGFGGFFVCKDGALCAVSTDPVGEQTRIRTALASIQEQTLGLQGRPIRLIQGEYSFAQLNDWKTQLRAVFGIPGAVSVDANERMNKVVVAVTKDANLDDIEALIARFEIPRSAVVLDETPRPQMLDALLTDKIRPIVNGIQVSYNPDESNPDLTPKTCSLGFSAFDDHWEYSDGAFYHIQRWGFVTASHCSHLQANIGQPSTFYQNITEQEENAVAIEVADPPCFTGGSCPADRRCRYSDALFAQYVDGKPGLIARNSEYDQLESDTTFAVGGIARPTEFGSIVFQPEVDFFRMRGQRSAYTGEVVSKVGVATGWTFGEVSATCVDIDTYNPLSQMLEDESPPVLLCQSVVHDLGSGLPIADHGDSGSPVFWTADPRTCNPLQVRCDEAEAVGLLWGGPTGVTDVFYFSDFYYVEDELGGYVGTYDYAVDEYL